MVASRSNDDRTAALKSLGGSLQQIDLIAGKIVSLSQRRIAAEEQFVHRVGVEFAAGHLSEMDLRDLYYEFRDIAASGFGKRWDAAVAIPWSKLTKQTGAWRPNGPGGSWHGSGVPIWPNDPCPANGISVVYVLYEADWSPCYVGSSEQFRQRIKAHKKTKAFEYWRAWPCTDRADAYRRESEMLAEVMPHLNKRREGRR
jgi:hypothetical protein